jgi:dipeptidyl aminopeptidase/acylaminoacyl peptidase
MVMRVALPRLALGLALLPALPSAAQASCSRLIPDATRSINRAVTARDIIELNEIGFADGAISGPSPLGISPDGKRIAFVVTRADIEANSYCRGLFILRLEPDARPRVIDSGGEFMPLLSFTRGLRVEVGVQQPVTPVWSPDGRFVAVLKREHGVTQVAILAADGRSSSRSTKSPVDVTDLWWSRDGKRLIFSSDSGIAAASARIDREAQSGWLYDDRIAPNYGARPRIEASDSRAALQSLDTRGGAVRPAGADDQRREAGHLVSPSGAQAWLAPESPSPVSGEQLMVKDPRGGAIACNAEACRGRFLGLWWAPGGELLWFLKREGWHRRETALYVWDTRTATPARSLLTEDVLDNCAQAASKLVCTSENSTHPRTIVLVDPATGRRETLFDPNPQFASLALGTVQRLKFRNDRGLEAWADLVLPSGYRGETKLPLVVVQYTSRGFLRGGTGNEYPIFPLAAAGYAVLSVDRPPAIASLDPNLKTDVELNAANEKDWAERRSVQSAILRAVDLAIGTGAVDSQRIGITGLSDGATAARFALLNSDRFAAAAISSCCMERWTLMTYGGIRWAEFNRAIGYPPATVDAPNFWRPVSMILNAGTIHRPLLIQQSDDEYLLSLDALEALREKKEPAELYVFPGEHHVKWQPRHKLAVFTRTLDWFDFWLRCREDPDPAKAAQYRRWTAMRPNAGQTAALCKQPSS